MYVCMYVLGGGGGGGAVIYTHIHKLICFYIVDTGDYAHAGQLNLI